MGSADVVLEARGLVKDYRRARAVDGVDLVVHVGERVALLGPNGAGKTTTLFMILGVVSPDAGSVTIGGIPLAKSRSRAAEQVGFAAGYLPLTERMRVHEYLTLFGQLYGLHDPSARIEAGLKRFRIEHLGEAMGTELSSGQRTLIGIVRATLHEPRLLVLDEPTASLDPDTADWVRSIIDDYRRTRSATIVLASHNMAEVERLADRVIMLERGRILADETPAGLVRRFGRATLEEVFLDIARRRAPHTLEALRSAQ